MRFSSHPTRRHILALAAGSAALPVPARAAAPSGDTVEVVHWWVDGGEGAAIRVIRHRVEDGGRTWVDTAVAGPDLAKAAALTRVIGGQPPTAMLWHAGRDLAELRRERIIRDVQAVAEADGWDAVLPPEVAAWLKVDGKYVAVPADLHCGNWTFANTGLLDRAGLDVPRTWPEVLTACARLQQSGVIPVAFGGQAWQEGSVFVQVLAGVGGRDLLRRFTAEHDLRAADRPALAETFRTFAALRPFVDKGSPNRSSTDTASLLATGRAALYFSGDWSRGDLNKAGMRPGIDYACGPAPGNDGIFLAVVDAFCMTETDDAPRRAAQDAFARLVMSRDVQHDFNLLKGAVPPREDVGLDGYDTFAEASARLIRGGGAVIPAAGVGMTTAMRTAFYDVVHRFWNTDGADPGSAADDLRAAVARTRE